MVILSWGGISQGITILKKKKPCQMNLGCMGGSMSSERSVNNPYIILSERNQVRVMRAGLPFFRRLEYQFEGADNYSKHGHEKESCADRCGINCSVDSYWKEFLKTICQWSGQKENNGYEGDFDWVGKSLHNLVFVEKVPSINKEAGPMVSFPEPNSLDV